MAESKILSPAEVVEEHHTESHAPYLKVFAGLAVFTAIEYFYAHIFKDAFAVLLGGLLFWAAIKAGMVGWYFMHLKFEGNWVYILIVPAFVLATMLVLALTPDQAMRPVFEEKNDDESAFVLPATRDSGPILSCRSILLADPIDHGAA